MRGAGCGVRERGRPCHTGGTSDGGSLGTLNLRPRRNLPRVVFVQAPENRGAADIRHGTWHLPGVVSRKPRAADPPLPIAPHGLCGGVSGRERLVPRALRPPTRLGCGRRLRGPQGAWGGPGGG